MKMDEGESSGLTNKKILDYFLWGGRLARPPITEGGQDVHPTRLDNLFFGNPLELKVSTS